LRPEASYQPEAGIQRRRMMKKDAKLEKEDEEVPIGEEKRCTEICRSCSRV